MIIFAISIIVAAALSFRYAFNALDSKSDADKILSRRVSTKLSTTPSYLIILFAIFLFFALTFLFVNYVWTLFVGAFFLIYR